MLPAIYRFPNTESLFRTLAHSVADLLAEGGSCVLPGGTSPLPLCRLLGGMSLPWEKITFLPTDERCVPPGDPAHNGSALQEALGNRGYRFLDFPPCRESAELETFARQVHALLPFRVVVLGMGEDGHTASLFPGHATLSTEGLVVAVQHAPKPPENRLSLTLSALTETNVTFVVATGRGKAEIVRELVEEKPLPIRLALGLRSSLFLDEEASALLPNEN